MGYISNYIYKGPEKGGEEIGLDEGYAFAVSEWRFNDIDGNGSMSPDEVNTLEVRIVSRTNFGKVFADWQKPARFFSEVPSEVMSHFRNQKFPEGEVLDSELELKDRPCFSVNEALAQQILKAINFALESDSADNVNSKDLFHGHLCVSHNNFNENLEGLGRHEIFEYINENPDTVSIILHPHEYTGVPNKDRKSVVSHGGGQPFLMRSTIDSFNLTTPSPRFLVTSPKDLNMRSVAGIGFEISENGQYELADGIKVNIWFTHLDDSLTN